MNAFEKRASIIANAGGVPRDSVVLDMVMPGENGRAVARELRPSMPDVPVRFVTRHSARAYIEEAFASGASGHVLKGRAAAERIPALREVRAGAIFRRGYAPMRRARLRARLRPGESPTAPLKQSK